MARRSKRQPQPLADLYDYLSDRPGELPAEELPPVSISSTDDWPEFVPVTDQEVRVGNPKSSSARCSHDDQVVASCPTWRRRVPNNAIPAGTFSLNNLNIPMAGWSCWRSPPPPPAPLRF